MRSIGVGVGALVAVLTLFGGEARAQEQEPAVVTVFHAVPATNGFPADVYLNGDLIIDGFVFETSSESFAVSPGEAALEIYPDGSDPGTDSPAVSTRVTLEGDKNYSVVALLVDGSPVISLYENDTRGLGPGEARLTFRQASSLAELSASLDGEETFTAVAATNEATTDYEAGTARLVIDDGSNTLFDQSVAVEDGILTIFYAVGDPESDSFDVLVQEVTLPQVSPAGVPTGSGGHRAASDGVWLMSACVVLAATGLVWGRRRLHT